VFPYSRHLLLVDAAAELVEEEEVVTSEGIR